MENETGKCLYCQEELKGRAGQKFCNTYCKSAYHNKTNLSNEAIIKTINQQLRRNRSALRTACPLGKATVRTEFLKSLGMEFKYYTHTYTSKNNQVYFFCYDYGYTNIAEPEKVLIVQWQPYMDS
jgi:hypothetical protein